MNIEKAIESQTFSEQPRKYLGISNLGEPCKRALWYDFRMCSKPVPYSSRERRLFQRGHIEELVIVDELSKLPGVTIEYIDIGEPIRKIFKNLFDHQLPETKQKKVEFCHGHGSGHSDGIFTIEKEGKKLLECKTSKTTKFNQLKRSRNLRQHNRTHYVQVQCYMLLLGLSACLYVMVCKETDERIYLDIELDKEFAEHELDRATKIIFMKTPPERIDESPEFYRCRPYVCKITGEEKLFCRHREICHFAKRVERSCRTCENVELHDKARWFCSKKKRFLAFKKQLKGCKKYQQLRG